MITVNIDKAKAIALKQAQGVKNETARAEFAQAIGNEQDVAALADVVQAIKTTVENTAESAEGGTASAPA